MAVPNKTLPDQSKKGGAWFPAFAQLYWVFGATVVLVFCAFYIVLHKDTFVVYIIYSLVTISLITVQFIAIKYFNVKTKNGKRETLSDWRLYTLALLIWAAFLIFVARTLAKYIGR